MRPTVILRMSTSFQPSGGTGNSGVAVTAVHLDEVSDDPLEDFSLSRDRGQKGHVYYRCHTRSCPITCLKEEEITATVLAVLSRLHLTDLERAFIRQEVEDLKRDWTEEREQQLPALTLRRDQIAERLNRLTDAYLDRAIEKDLFEQRKGALLMERRDVDENIASLKAGDGNVPDRIAQVVELASQAYLAYQAGSVERKRQLLKSVGSNLTVSGKNVDVTMDFPFSEIADRTKISKCGPKENRTPTSSMPWKRNTTLL